MRGLGRASQPVARRPWQGNALVPAPGHVPFGSSLESEKHVATPLSAWQSRFSELGVILSQQPAFRKRQNWPIVCACPDRQGHRNLSERRDRLGQRSCGRCLHVICAGAGAELVAASQRFRLSGRLVCCQRSRQPLQLGAGGRFASGGFHSLAGLCGSSLSQGQLVSGA